MNALFDPPAQFDKTFGYYVTDCTARAPRLGIDIGGRTLWISGESLLRPSHIPDKCSTGITSKDKGSSIVLGDVFLENVLAVFDVGGSEMRFASREYS